MKIRDLYKVDVLSFNSKIGYVTNLGTTLYEMQSQYEDDSPEYKEINNRLKLCCAQQNAVIDAAKGIKVREFPKHWTKYQPILEDDSPEERARKEFENKLIIEKRPEFMKYLYSHYMKEYKAFRDDFDKYCLIKLGKKYDELTEADKNSDIGKEIVEYYNKKNPLLETNGVMNRVSRYMQAQLKEIKTIGKDKNTEELFEKLYNADIPLDETKLELLLEKRKDYDNFKKSKQLKDSEFSTYEQYYKFLRNDCLEKISSNIQELANIAVYICYHLYPSKPKNFCWDVFGNGIVENLKEKNKQANVPLIDNSGDIDYLYDKYKLHKVSVSHETEDIDEFDILEFENALSGFDDELTDEDFEIDFDDMG